MSRPPYRPAKEIAADIRKNLKREFPDWKFSVVKKDYSGGRNITVDILKAPIRVTQGPLPVYGDCQVDTRASSYEGQDASSYHPLTREGFAAVKRIVQIVNAENWDDSDAMIDHFDVNYYTHMSIGHWPNGFDQPEGGAVPEANGMWTDEFGRKRDSHGYLIQFREGFF